MNRDSILNCCPRNPHKPKNKGATGGAGLRGLTPLISQVKVKKKDTQF